jgi:hypothetical protein
VISLSTQEEEKMNFAKRLLMVSGAVMLAGIVGVLVNPKAAHAVFTLVQVANDSAHPVPTVATDLNALTVFDVAGTCSFINLGLDCETGPIYGVPAGKIAVIERVAGSCSSNSGVLSSASISYIGSGGAQNTMFLAHTPLVIPGGGGGTQFSQNLTAYAFGGAAGTQISAVFNNSAVQTGGACYVDIAGHLI